MLHIGQKSTHFFVMTRGIGSARPSNNEPYELKYCDKHRKNLPRQLGTPVAVDKYYHHCNTIGVHNQLRQGYLRYEKL